MRNAKQRIVAAVQSHRPRQLFRMKDGTVIDGIIVKVIDKPTVLVRQPSGQQTGLVIEGIEEMVDAEFLDNDMNLLDD